MNGTSPAASRVAAPAAAALAAGAYLLLMPWDPRANVPVEPGSDTLTTGHTWWGVGLFILILVGLAATVGRFTDRPGVAMAAVGGVPSALLLASYLTHEPEADGFDGLWPTSWLFAAVLMVAGSCLVAALARPGRDSALLPGDANNLLLPAVYAGVAAFTAFFLKAIAADSGPVARTVSGILSLALGYGLGWALRATGRGLGTTVALVAGAVVLIAAIDNSAAPLWGRHMPDLAAWTVTVAAYVLGTALAFAVHPGRAVPTRPAH
ncbi:hypothetical protein [Streptomyces paludis]|uniref:Uncharacterized protein n=1 Tax=Streptomyces paludis TaxID=2282738 RepID=A0A345HQE1_9ACTN|nr:hypothetical protein [Streptomyces paludis]AXG78915.1 hypothetical protein DVK44_15770 [Streptomyces paludis]